MLGLLAGPTLMGMLRRRRTSPLGLTWRLLGYAAAMGAMTYLVHKKSQQQQRELYRRQIDEALDRRVEESLDASDAVAQF